MRMTNGQLKTLFPAMAKQLEVDKASKKKARVPQAPSEAEEIFALHCKAKGLPTPTREHLFANKIPHEPRLWRFDFAWPEFKVATEIEGLVAMYVKGVCYAVGRHATFQGFEGDCMKYSMAARLGWLVLRFNQRLVKSGCGVDETKALLQARGWQA